MSANWSKVQSKNRLSRDINRYRTPAYLTKVDRGVNPGAPRCAKCGTYMVVRFSRYGRFWACGNCKSTQGT
jgi:ribosomal protein S27AE